MNEMYNFNAALLCMFLQADKLRSASRWKWKQVWYFISKNQPGLSTFQSTQLSLKPFWIVLWFYVGIEVATSFWHFCSRSALHCRSYVASASNSLLC